MTNAFPLVDRYHTTQLGADISRAKPGSPFVVESDRRIRRADSYGYVHALWWVWIEDDRSVVSVPPGAGAAVDDIARGVGARDELHDPGLARRLTAAVAPALCGAGMEPVTQSHCDLVFACNAALLQRREHPDCRRLVDDSLPSADGIWFPAHCLPDGTAYGAVADEQVVSVAYAHRTGIMEDRVACLGVETAAAYRQRGYARACVAGVVAEIASRGGEARYGCSPANVASQATARSVGFVPYGVGLILATPEPE